MEIKKRITISDLYLSLKYFTFKADLLLKLIKKSLNIGIEHNIMLKELTKKTIATTVPNSLKPKVRHMNSINGFIDTDMNLEKI